jgi:hypothetical protein
MPGVHSHVNVHVSVCVRINVNSVFLSVPMFFESKQHEDEHLNINIVSINMYRYQRIFVHNSNLYIIPNVRIELYRKISFISLPMSLNEIGDEFRFQQNRTTFKITLLNQLMEQLLTS